jgi:hypothetical protein
MRNTPSAPVSPGRIRLIRLLISPQFRMSRNSGMIVTWIGTIREASSSANRAPLPGKRIRAKA